MKEPCISKIFFIMFVGLFKLNTIQKIEVRKAGGRACANAAWKE